MSQQAVVSLTAEELLLSQWARAGSSEQRLVERAKVILLLNQEPDGDEARPGLKMAEAICRAARGGIERLTPIRLLALLDEPPPSGYGKWSGPLLAQALGDVSDDQVWRILRKYDICLDRRRSWYADLCK